MYDAAIKELREEANRLKELAYGSNGLIDTFLIAKSNEMLRAAMHLEAKTYLDKWKQEVQENAKHG